MVRRDGHARRVDGGYNDVVDAYRGELEAARARIQELEAELGEAHADLARLKDKLAGASREEPTSDGVSPRRKNRPLENRMGLGLGLLLMAAIGLGAQLSRPRPTPRVLLAELVQPAAAGPVREGRNDNQLPEGEQLLADPLEVDLPKLAPRPKSGSEAGADVEGDGSERWKELEARFLLGKAQYAGKEYRGAITTLEAVVREVGTSDAPPDWLSDAYLFLARSAEREGRNGLALQAYDRAYGLEDR